MVQPASFHSAVKSGRSRLFVANHRGKVQTLAVLHGPQVSEVKIMSKPQPRRPVLQKKACCTSFSLSEPNATARNAWLTGSCLIDAGRLSSPA